jgi:hypothetical protein
MGLAWTITAIGALTLVSGVLIGFLDRQDLINHSDD